MTKKFEDKESAQNIGHYYIKEHFVKFKEPIFLKKKQAQKTIEPKFKSHFFTPKILLRYMSQKLIASLTKDCLGMMLLRTEI